jgi:hypothetical protein
MRREDAMIPKEFRRKRKFEIKAFRFFFGNQGFPLGFAVG